MNTETVSASTLDDLELLREIESWLLHNLDLERLMHKACVAIAAHFAVRATWLGEKQADGSVRLVAASDQVTLLRELQIRWDDSAHGQGSVGESIRTRRAVMKTTDSKALGPWRSLAEHYGVQAVLSLPLLVHDEIIGVLALYSLQRDGFAASSMRRYMRFAEGLAAILLLAQEQAQLRLLSTAMSKASQAIFITDANGTIVWFNQALCLLSGYSEAKIMARPAHTFSAGCSDKVIWQSIWKEVVQGRAWSGDVLMLRKDGSVYHVLQSITPLLNQQGKVSKFLCMQQDMTEKKELEREIEYLAYHDVLTGLPNRALFHDRMRQMVSQAKRDRTNFALCFVDLDGFKLINDTHGHAAGDQLLKQVSSRLRACVREVDTVARLGGDEFVILLRDAKDEMSLSNVAQKIIERLAHVFELGAVAVKVSASIGISRYPNDAASAEQLMRCADDAMYRAKHEGKNRFVFWRSGDTQVDASDWQI
jgi:diguanylate cyclase (GGDEF)-like protein/PAS domain S-box-containing protein